MLAKEAARAGIAVELHTHHCGNEENVVETK
jgi:hypothetical protein